eukprot:85977-Lingulodinium_polyedra.AAC.1
MRRARTRRVWRFPTISRPTSSIWSVGRTSSWSWNPTADSSALKASMTVPANSGQPATTLPLST